MWALEHRSLSSKDVLVNEVIADHQIDCFSLTETWHLQSFSGSLWLLEYFFPQYRVCKESNELNSFQILHQASYSPLLPTDCVFMCTCADV